MLKNHFRCRPFIPSNATCLPHRLIMLNTTNFSNMIHSNGCLFITNVCNKLSKYVCLKVVLTKYVDSIASISRNFELTTKSLHFAVLIKAIHSQIQVVKPYIVEVIFCATHNQTVSCPVVLVTLLFNLECLISERNHILGFL